MIPDHETLLLLNAYTDGELSPGETLAMERRLAVDPDLRREADRLNLLSRVVRDALDLAPASPALRARVIRQVGFGGATHRQPWLQARGSLAAALLIGLLGGGLIGGGTQVWLSTPGSRQTEDFVVAGHLRGLIGSQPFDIASSNRHVVKPWFNGKTTVAPEAVDLADKGFPLVGGRIDIVAGRPVPTLVYRHDQHVISVTVVPTTRTDGEGEDRRDGYTVRHWSTGDLDYWLVSDLDASGLDLFERSFREQSGSSK